MTITDFITLALNPDTRFSRLVTEAEVSAPTWDPGDFADAVRDLELRGSVASTYAFKVARITAFDGVSHSVTVTLSTVSYTVEVHHHPHHLSIRGPR